MRNIKYLDKQQVEDMLKIIQQWDIRDKLMIYFSLFAGLRAGEVVGLNCSDVWNNISTYTGIDLRPEIAKGHKAAYIPLKDSIITLLEQYRIIVHPHPVCATVMIPLFKSKITGARLTRDMFYKIVTKATLLATGQKLGPHTLRHTFATMLMKKADLKTVQAALRHESILSTEIYLHASKDDIREGVNKL